MLSKKNILPTKRRFTIMIGFFLLLAVFFSLFQFYYIPSNRDQLHQYGFMLLNRMKINIIERDNDLRKYYNNTVKDILYKSDSSINDILDQRKFKDRFVLNPIIDTCSSTRILRGSSNEAFDQFGFIKAQDEWLRVYKFNKIGFDGSVGLAQSGKKFFESAFSYRRELFESYMVVNHCDDKAIVLYHDESLGIGENIQQDSLLRQSIASKNSQIFDIQIRGVNYKMFTYPFEMGAQNLVLCGIMKASNYTNSLRNIPAGLIYSLLILAMILIVALPFVKPYLLSPQEKLNTSDLYFMGVGLFAGLTLITLLVIQSLILSANGKREKEDLDDLTARLRTAFLKDIRDASRQLSYFDSTLCNEKSYNISDTSQPWLNLYGSQRTRFLQSFPETFRIPIRDSVNNTDPYYFMSRVSWVNADGMQTIKIQQDSLNRTQLIDVKERGYYKLLKENKGYLLPGSDRQPFVIDPVISWSIGEYQINMAQESKYCDKQEAKYVILSSNFPSVVETVFPPGYGYCLIDQKGNVLSHSEKSRNLRENFLDETGRDITLIEAMNSRQEAYFSRIRFYGKPFALRISPVSELPFHLVVFHNKSYQIPIILRVLSFALLFLFLFYILAFAVLFLFRKLFGLTPKYSIFKPAIAYRDWLLPSTTRVNFYIIASCVIAVYIAIFLTFCIFLKGFRTDNFVSLVIMLFTPVNILGVLFLLEKLLVGKLTTERKHMFFRAVAISFSIIVILAIFVEFDSKWQRWQFLLFETSWMSLPLIVYYLDIKNRMQVSAGFNSLFYRRYYLNWYSRFVLAMIICLTIMPACVFTWFAHNYEIRQSVKKQQLSLAGSLMQRRVYLQKYFRNYDFNRLPDSFAYYAQYKAGVYPLFDDKIIEVNTRLATPQDIDKYIGTAFFDSVELKKIAAKRQCMFSCLDKSETFYLDLADQLSPNYRDPSYLPALANVSTDSSWYWFNDDTSMFFYKKNPYIHTLSGNDSLPYGILIRSTIPPRFVLLNSSRYFLLILIFTIVLIWFLFRLIRKTAANIFLPDHDLSPIKVCAAPVKKPGNNTRENDAEELGNIAKENLFIQSEEIEARIKGEKFDVLKSQYNELKYDSSKTDTELLRLVDINQSHFNRVWERLNDKQKILLLDMAQDGLINYRNTIEISDLCKKGLLIVADDRMQLFSYAFGYFLRTYKSEDRRLLDEKFGKGGTWASFKIPMMVIILSIAVFIFATQQDIWNKVIGLVGSLTAILTLLQRFIFTKSAPKE